MNIISRIPVASLELFGLLTHFNERKVLIKSQKNAHHIETHTVNLMMINMTP